MAEGAETFDLMLNLEQSDDGQLTGPESIMARSTTEQPSRPAWTPVA